MPIVTDQVQSRLADAWAGIAQTGGLSRFLALWAEDGIWDFPSAPSERSYEATLAGRSAVAARLAYAVTGKVVELNSVSTSDDAVTIISTLHSPTRAVLMALTATIRNGQITCLKEFYDPALLPIRWIFRLPDDQRTSAETDWPADRRLTVPTTSNHASYADYMSLDEMRVISS